MAQPWLVWDGTCGICNATAQWVRRKDTERRIVICSYQNCTHPVWSADLTQRAQGEVLWIDEAGQVSGGGRAVLKMLRVLGYRGLGWIAWPPFIWVWELGYRLVARNRNVISRRRYPEVDSQP
jgi:predicted DCC family thiol-disulfide oxidoreductase YuxK